MRKPNLLASLVRIVLFTVLITLLCFAIALFVGIVGVSVANYRGGGGMSLSVAYRNIALPVALIAFVVSFVAMTITEVRLLRRKREQYDSWRRAA